MIRSMWAISFPSPTNDSPMKKSAAITTSRSGWGPRVISAGRHECGVRAAWSEGVEGQGGPRLRVAPTEPYRWGANLPAASAGVKAARLVALWDVFGVIPAADRRSRRATLRPPAIRDAAARNRAPRASSVSRAERSRACAPSARPGVRPTNDCCDARCGVVPSWALDSQRPLFRRLEFRGRRPHRRREPSLGEVALHQSQTEVIPGAFGQHLATPPAGGGGESAREEPQPQAESRRVEERRGRAPQERVELPDPAILPTR